MILKFPDLASLRLALTTGAVPPSVAAAPARYREEPGGSLCVETAATLSRASRSELKRLGVGIEPGNESSPALAVGSWCELLPLQAGAAATADSDRTPVLFELAAGTEFAELVSEILRLGNDRQSFRWLENGRGETRALLRVVGPPYYSLLRAIDGAGRGDAPVAFVERAPRIWVEWGQTHPLVDQIQVPQGQILLLRVPRRWCLLEDAPFRDIYEVLEFALPAAPADYVSSSAPERIRVTPTLRAGGSTDGAELWVLRRDAVAELNRFVQNSDDQLLSRLGFAVAERDGETVVIVRKRQSRQAAPILVLNAIACKSYLKLPNLFLPAGMRLHPPLRRDAVRKLLAEDADRVTWLSPHADNSFTAESVPESAFRPLSDWVDYVLDKDRLALEAWMQSFQFEFEEFLCDDEQPKPAPGRKRARAGAPGPRNDVTPAPAAAPTAEEKSEPGEVPATVMAPLLEIVPIEPSEAQKRLKILEQRFVAAEGGLDSPERTGLWPELATLNAALGRSDEAAICWLHALWNESDAAPARARAWFEAEESGVPLRPSGEPAPDRPRPTASTGVNLDRLLAADEPMPAELRTLAAFLAWSGARTPPSSDVIGSLGAIQRVLERNERFLPVRAVWLAWLNLARLAGDDVLALARTRDRLLARLYANGLRPDQDLPAFLRHSGAGQGTRFRAVGPWLIQLCERARQWSQRQGHELLTGAGERTIDYIDLLFAFGLARSGEAESSRRLLERASANLAERDHAHQVLLAGFRYRIEQALAGKVHGGPLPNEQLEYLGMLSRDRLPNEPDLRYVANRMRAISRILEPDQRVDPYGHVHARTDGDLASELAQLPEMLDAGRLAERVLQLLRQPPKGHSGADSRAQIVRAGLNEAPRVGEDFANKLLEQVAPVYDALSAKEDLNPTIRRAELLEKALFVAVHFDRADYLPRILHRFEALIDRQRGSGNMEALELLARHCFRGLRKLGMRDEIDRMLALMADVLLQGAAPSSLDALADKPAALQALLHVAEGWLYFGQDARAEVALEAARAILFSGQLVGKAGKIVQHTNLAGAYALALGQAPAEMARRRLEELFEKLNGVRDVFATKEHYSQSQIKVVEAVILAVAGDDATSDSQVRRWLDDDEFLVRRRIHRDLREMMNK